MAFDLSRNTFNPLNDYLGVVMQQGRVHLDSDWNELLAEFTRRIQAGTLDIIGLSGVPSTTPGAFQIGVWTDPGNNVHVSIGVGRMYVDGILAENHGSASQWDPTLGDFAGSPGTSVDYTLQPYVLMVPPATLPPGTGPFLVYLDVWQRDVSYLQDSSLVDPAVGVDTTGRLQTVWQVKLLDVPGGFVGSTPDSAIWTQNPPILPQGPIWQTLIQGSPSLLTNLTNGAPTVYTGQENQLYRVEIHQGGAQGTATFKWSRENASVATSVTAITPVTNTLNNPASQLTVASLGRDQVLGFSPGDWIEITDDYLELNGTSAQPGSASSMLPGELHQIVSINVAALTITLDSPVTTIQPITPLTHTRIRRWDQTGTVYQADGQTVWGKVASSGILVPPSGTSLLLENGITVGFDLNPLGAGAFQTGDYWTFAARAADGSVAPLSSAPPAGIEHHISRLAILTLAGTPGATDCRAVFQSLSNPAIRVISVGSVSGASLLYPSTTGGGTLSVQDLAQGGIQIIFDSPIDPGIITTTSTPSAPICSITVYLPDTDGGWFNPVMLAGGLPVTPPTTPPSTQALTTPLMGATVNTSLNSIIWTPASAVQAQLLGQIQPGQSVLARLTLKGASIWAPIPPSLPQIYLNGAVPPDGRVSADFDTWFWINSQPPVTVSPPGLLAFGNQAAGAPSPPMQVTITNNSDGQLTFTDTSFAVTGTNAADFALTTNTCGTGISGNASCTIGVVFTPTPATPASPLQPLRTASLNITTSLATPPAITLTGTALAPWLLATPVSLNFPATIVGQTSALTVTLSNSGTLPLSISQISISGTAAAAPAVARALAKTTDVVKAADLKTTDVVKAADIKTADVKTADIKITDVKVTDVIVIPPGSTSAPGDFSQTSNCVPPEGGTLQPGQACTVTVSFKPSATGVRTAYLNIAHNAAGSLNSIPLGGSGIQPKPKDTPEKKDKDIAEKIADRKISDAVLSAIPTTPAEKPAGAAENSAALKSFITAEERPPVHPPASDPSKAVRLKKRPKPR